MLKLALACTIRDEGTISGIVDVTAGLKNAAHVPRMIPAAKAIQISRTPNIAAIPTKVMHMPRMKSISNIIFLLSVRSTITPAKGEIRTLGSKAVAISAPINPGEPVL
ncbi:hypothetical protein D1872_310920 [compost metagenome]